MQCGRTPNQVEVVGLVDRKRFVNITVWIHIRCHWPIQRQTTEGVSFSL